MEGHGNEKITFKTFLIEYTFGYRKAFDSNLVI